MSRSNYSFLDYTVMPFLRKRVISSDAAVLFSSDLDEILWANAVGTRLLGGDTVIELLETPLSEAHPLVHQLQGAAHQLSYQSTGDDPVVRRFKVSRGLRTEMITGELSEVSLPNGERCILLICSHESDSHRYREHELARLSVDYLDGFADAAAIVDEYGLILASSNQFDAMDVNPATLEELVSVVASEADRLVKRPIQSGYGKTIAAGLGRIRDLPQRYLIVLAETETSVDEIEPTYLSETDTIPAATAPAIPDAQEQPRTPDSEIHPSEMVPPWIDDPNEVETATGETEQTSSALISEDIGSNDPDPETPQDTSQDETEGSSQGGSLLDRWYFADEDSRPSSEAVNDSDEDQSPLPSATVATENNVSQEAPSRFAFTIDRQRIIQSVSDELEQAVGPKSADIVGKSWPQISSERGFDENGIIGSLLEKSDTWSGKTVLWPIENTDMVVPIDLAALPVFDRDRAFDGFRGFGIIRSADTIVDPGGTGFQLGLGLTAASDEIETRPDLDDQQDGYSGWKPDLSQEENELQSEAETGSEKVEEEDAETGVSGDNIFQLPNMRTDVENDTRQDDTTMQPANDLTQDDIETDNDNRLNGREKRAFTEIRERLNKEHGRDVVPEKNDPAITDAPDDDDRTELPHLVYGLTDTLHANEGLLQLTGYASSEELEDAGGLEALLRDDTPAGSSSSNAMIIRHKDGSDIEVTSHLSKISWQEESALCLSFRPVDAVEPGTGGAETDGANVLDMARLSELQSILETAADGLLVIDEAGKIESVNASGEALFDVDQSTMIGKPFTSLFATESRSILEKHLDELKSPGVTGILNQGHEVIGIEAKGGLIPLFATIGKIGESGRFCAVLRDLTDWKKTEEELVEAKRKAETASDQKSEFLSRVSHEIREPLTSIIGFSDVMIGERFGKIDNERYREYLKDINRSGVHVLDLVNDLLDISKIEAGKLELSYEAVDLNKLAGETVALLQPKANLKRIIIRTSLSRSVPKVVADARSIRQIILNLVSNAIQHSNRNSQVIVSTTYEENGEVALRIRDTGSGMSETEIERALEPFVQVSGDTAMSGGGTGLGLPLTKALVEANRAYFDLESAKGEGTIAHIQFPSQRVLAD